MRARYAFFFVPSTKRSLKRGLGRLQLRSCLVKLFTHRQLLASGIIRTEEGYSIGHLMVHLRNLMRL